MKLNASGKSGEVVGKEVGKEVGKAGKNGEAGEAASAEALRLDDFVPYRLSALTNTISGTLARRYASRFGVSIPQWRVMAVLGESPGRSVNELAARTRMDKVSVSRAVAALVRSGRVLRRSDPADGRRRALRLSARGREIYRQIVPLAQHYQAELLARLDRAERRNLDRLIGHLDAIALSLAADDREGGA